MPSFLKHPFVKFGAGLVGILFLLLVVAIVLASLGGARSTGFSGDYVSNIAPQATFTEGAAMGRAMMAPAGMADMEIVGDYSEPMPPLPDPSGYVPNLETYETSSYNLSGRLRDFETACDTLESLKADGRYHFKYLTSNLNNCRATFFTDEAHVAEALNRLEQFNGVTVSRNTQSVTRHRENIQSRASIIRQQLDIVERTLAEAEAAYTEIEAFARAERDVAEYSKAVDTKLRQIDQLTNRKINLTSQLQGIAQQAADLEERIGVTELSVSFSRSYTLNPDKNSRAWERAWETLSDTWTNFGTGLTAYFGVFVLYVVQYSLYLLVLIVAARFGWKAVRKIWTL